MRNCLQRVKLCVSIASLHRSLLRSISKHTFYCLARVFDLLKIKNSARTRGSSSWLYHDNFRMTSTSFSASCNRQQSICGASLDMLISSSSEANLQWCQKKRTSRKASHQLRSRCLDEYWIGRIPMTASWVPKRSWLIRNMNYTWFQGFDWFVRMYVASLAPGMAGFDEIE